MAVEPLSEQLTRAGGHLVGVLDQAGVSPQGVLWLHFHSLNDWRLTVVSDLVESLGRKRTYALVEKALAKIGQVDGLTMFDIHLASPLEIMPQVLGGAFGMDDGIARLHDSSVNGILVDAVIYRLRPSRPPAEQKAAARKAERALA